MAEFEKMDLSSADLVAERIEQLKRLLPEVATEGGIDFDKLRLVLGDEVDEGTERYAFTWPGKTDAIRQSQTPSTATLRPAPEESKYWDETENLYIEGDNLEVLKLLQHSYHGRVKLIYIDPPYNTGHDFVYKDSFSDTIENYRQQAGLAGQSNADTSGRYHSTWCSMMYPRLRLARELLADDGAIFISMSDIESANLRKMCDEVFGEACFVANAIWQNNTSPRNDAKGIPYTTDNVLIYGRQPDWQPQRLARTDDMDARYESPDNDPQPWTSSPYHAPSAKTHRGMVYAVQHPFTGALIYPPKGRCWSREQSRVLEAMCEWAPYELRMLEDIEERASICGVETKDMPDIAAVMLAVPPEEAKRLATSRLERGVWPEFYFTGNGFGGLRVKKHLDLTQGKVAATLWPASEVGTNTEATNGIKALFDGAIPFDTPKPVRLLRRVLDIASDEDSIVLDFFSGSATMADAVMQKNAEGDGRRRFIMVQLPEHTSGDYSNVCEAGKERIRRAGAKIAAEIEEANKQLRLGEEPKPIPDVGFRVLKLDESGIERPKSGELLLDVIKPDRSDEDIIFEMMLKWGLELTLPIEKVDAAGYTCYSVAYGELVCCLAPGLNMQVLDAIADMEPRRVLMLDRNLDDTTKLNAVQAFKRVEEKTGREVELRTV